MGKDRDGRCDQRVPANGDITKSQPMIAATNPRSSYTVEHLENAFDVEVFEKLG